MIFPGNPVHFKAAIQLNGLNNGDFILQPKWDGRRGVWDPKTGLWYKSGKPVDAKPWKNLVMPRKDIILDLELMRDRPIVLDIIVPNLTLSERLLMAKDLGLEIMSFDVSSAKEVIDFFTKCRTSGICDGVVLKRKDSYYPMNNSQQLNCPHWVKVKDESIHLIRNI